MGIPVLILGESGSGKTTSLRNFEKNQVCVFNVAGKPLPFRKKLYSVAVPEKATTSDGKVIDSCNFITRKIKALEQKGCKAFVIDDSQYLMAFALFSRAKETGYGKFTDIAVSFRNLIKSIVEDTNPDTIVYLLHHTETQDGGKVKAKTSGKMLDSQLTVEGLFVMVLLCVTDGTKHSFITQSDGNTTAKSPMEMFPLEIDNDLAMVDETIREYYGLNQQNINNTEEK